MTHNISVFITTILCITFSTAQWIQVPDHNRNCCEEYCYATDPNPNLFYATRTAYELVYDRNSKQHLVPECKPVFFWSFNRHGTRLPKKSHIEQFIANIPKLRREILNNYEVRKSYPRRGKLCYQDLENLKNWNWDPNITTEYASVLTSQGIDDLKYLAKRYQTKFPNLLGVPYNEQDFVFRHTQRQRVESSFRSFVEGLFGNDASQVNGMKMEVNDNLIGTQLDCYLQSKKVLKENENSELNKFIKSPEYQKLIKDVSTRLGFKYDLNATAMRSMYNLCGFEQAWYVNESSPWCAVFTKEQIKIMEYAADLKEYYLTGYGNDLSAKWGCNVVKDMMSYLDKVGNNETGVPKAVVSFTHNVRVEELLVALGFEKDKTPLTADSYLNAEERKWKTSKVSAFASNLAVVFYECANTAEKQVMFFLNERPVEHSDCQDGLCRWQTVRDRLGSIANSCTLGPCDESRALRQLPYSILALLLLSFVVIKNV